MNNIHDASVDRLFDVISKLNTKEECKNFFLDVCTIYEILDMSKRLSAAILLDEGCSYQEIIKKIDISTATLSRVSKSLSFGEGGYKNAIKKIKKNI